MGRQLKSTSLHDSKRKPERISHSNRIHLQSGTNVAIFDVGEDNCSICQILLNISWHTSGDGTRTSAHPRLIASSINWVGGIQPKHVGIVVIPERHDKNTTSLKDGVNSLHATLFQEVGAILGVSNPISAKLVRDGVVFVAIDRVHWMLNGLAILSVKLFHLHNCSLISAIISDELSGHCDWLGAVNCEIFANAPEFFLLQTVWLDVTTILVTHTFESVFTIVTTVSAFASVLFIIGSGTGMHGESGATVVGFPQINLCATRTIPSSACILISFAWAPILLIGLVIDPLEVMWALRITIARAILGTRIPMARSTSILVHRHKIQGTIEATINLTVIYSESELT